MLRKVEFYPDILARRTVETDLTNSNVCYGVFSSHAILSGYSVDGWGRFISQHSLYFVSKMNCI